MYGMYVCILVLHIYDNAIALSGCVNGRCICPQNCVYGMCAKAVAGKSSPVDKEMQYDHTLDNIETGYGIWYSVFGHWFRMSLFVRILLLEIAFTDSAMTQNRIQTLKAVYAHIDRFPIISLSRAKGNNFDVQRNSH